MSVIKKGDKVKIASDVEQVLLGLGFEEGSSSAIGEQFAGTEQLAHSKRIFSKR